MAFDVIGPWTRPHRDRERGERDRQRFLGTFVALALVGLLLAACLVARQNLQGGTRRLHRRAPDLGGHRHRIDGQLAAVVDARARSGRRAEAPVRGHRRSRSSATGFVWLLYIALEPWVRRFWPDTLKGWSRLVSGRVSDPRVGRDVMIGLAFGLGLQLVVRLTIPLHDLLGVPGPPPLIGRVELLAGPVYALGQLFAFVSTATFNALVIVFLIVGLKVGLKRMPLVVIGTILFYVIISVPATMSEGGTPWIGATLAVISIVVLVTVPVRYGLLATNVAFFASYIASAVPWSLDFGSWQAYPTELACLVLVTMAAWSGWTATGGRSVAA